MFTLRFQESTLLQIHRNHVLGDFPVVGAQFRFTAYTGKSVKVITDYTLTGYHNFYLVTIDTDALKKLNKSCRLDVLTGTGDLIYSSDVFLTA